MRVVGRAIRQYKTQVAEVGILMNSTSDEPTPDSGPRPLDYSCALVARSEFDFSAASPSAVFGSTSPTMVRSMASAM